MHVEFILCTFIFQRTRFMSNAACSVSVDKYLELFMQGIWQSNSIIFVFLKICNCFKIKIVSRVDLMQLWPWDT